LVFLLDSSISTTNDLEVACRNIQSTNGILADLRAYLGNDHVYGGGVALSCEGLTMCATAL